MSVFLIVLLSIVLLLLCLVLFLLFSPLWIHVVYKDKLTVVAGLSFIKIRLVPGKNKKHKKKTEYKNVPSKNDKEDRLLDHNNDKNQSQDKKGSIFDTVSMVLDIVKSFFEMMGKKAKVVIRELRVSVCCEDAANTAIVFGLCSGAVSTILAICSGAGECKIDHENVGAVPDFISGKSSFSADIKLSAPTISIIISVIKGYLKNRDKQDRKDGKR